MAIYKRPGWLTQHIANPIVAFMTGRLGRSLHGSRILTVRGRSSGEWRKTPITPLVLDGRRYLVAPRGKTQWVRNLRATGSDELRLGQSEESFQATELPNEDKVLIIGADLQARGTETAVFFGVSANPSEDELARIAPNHPIFLVSGEQ